MTIAISVLISVVFALSYLLGVYYSDKLLLQSTTTTVVDEVKALGLSLLIGLSVPVISVLIILSL